MPAPFSRVVKLPPAQPTDELRNNAASNVAKVLFIVISQALEWKFGSD
jgi:hypothetical protein